MEFKNISHDLGVIAKDYDYQPPPDIVLKLQQLIASLLRFLKDFFAYLKLPQFEKSDTSVVANLLQAAVVLVGVIAAVGVILLVASKLRALQIQKNIALGGMIVGESPLDSGGWHSLAEELNQKGSYKEACRAIYMSVLHLFDEEKVMALSTSKTNYEYFYALKKLPAVAAAFRNLVDRVEEIWFGDRAASANDYEECRLHATQVRNALPKPAVLITR